LSQGLHEGIEELRGRGRFEGLKKVWAPPLSGIRVECELRDSEDLSTNIEDIFIESLLVILKDPHPHDLIDHRLNAIGGVSLAESDEEHESVLNGPDYPLVDGDVRL
jgi:hypothetical protein